MAAVLATDRQPLPETPTNSSPTSTDSATGSKTAESSTTKASSVAEAVPGGPYSAPKLQLEERFIDEPRSLKVAVIGAGLAGITAGALLPAKVPGIQLTIYEKNADLGGTWYENIYPGVRCDIPATVYQSTFQPNRNWSEKFAQGSEIRDYWQSFARKYDVYKYAKLKHLVTSAEWDNIRSKWVLNVSEQLDDGTSTASLEEFDFVLTCIGRFNAWKLPDIPGIGDYKGVLRHASHYDSSFDPKGKRVAVIGNGASGIQLLPSMQDAAAHVDHYVRSKTWIATSWAGDERTTEPQRFSAEEQESLQDPEKYLQYRKELEDKYWRRLDTYLKGTDASNQNRELFTKVIHHRLAKKPELAEEFIPDFSPNCRRLTPGPGYLEALCADNVTYIKTPITRFTPTGVETSDGQQRDVDAIFCATGANASMAPPFPIRVHGKDLSKEWTPSGQPGFPFTYLGLAAPKFPNILFIMGPHGAGISGTVPHETETSITYCAKLLRKVSREGIKTIVPSDQAAHDFLDYADAFFARSVLSEGCSSWYKASKDARIHGVWPGSAAHVTIIRAEPRWEDFEYEYLGRTENRFEWYFGNGRTRKEGQEGSDMTAYLDAREADLRQVHEKWWNP